MSLLDKFKGKKKALTGEQIRALGIEYKKMEYDPSAIRGYLRLLKEYEEKGFDVSGPRELAKKHTKRKLN